MVRCRLGKLAFFISERIARYARLQKPPNHCSALGSRSFITAQIDLAICPSLLLKLSISFVYLTAHKGVNYLVYINNNTTEINLWQLLKLFVIKCYLVLKSRRLML